MHADILTYALFLCALAAAARPNWPRSVCGAIFAALIPVKLISVVFLPAALVADILCDAKNLRDNPLAIIKLLRQYAVAIVLSALAVTSVLLFNRYATGYWISPSLYSSTTETMLEGPRIFLFSIPREFLFYWHGSVSSGLPLAAFCLSNIIAFLCLISLRLNDKTKWFLIYSLACIGLSVALLFVRTYTPTVRLLGYGLIALFFGLRPQRWANPLWALYAALSVVVAITNVVTINSLGAVDPRYRELAKEVAEYVDANSVIATNSYHILDINQNVASVPIQELSEAKPYSLFLWVTLPRFDPISDVVWKLDRPGSDWCERKQLDGGLLFEKCQPIGPKDQ